jgi:hypothetical protein
VARDALGEALELLAYLLRRRFGRSPGHSFVMLAAERPQTSLKDQVTERIPVLRDAVTDAA